MTAKDPEHLPSEYKPAVVKLVDSTELFVAHQVDKDSGWLSVIGWNGSIRRIPPQRVSYVDIVDVNLKSEGQGSKHRQWKVITDPDLVEEAREAARLSETSDIERREIEK